MSHADDSTTREGTDALKAIAEEVEAERESGRSTAVPHADTPEDDGETREDHEGDDADSIGVAYPAENTPRG